MGRAFVAEKAYFLAGFWREIPQNWALRVTLAIMLTLVVQRMVDDREIPGVNYPRWRP